MLDAPEKSQPKRFYNKKEKKKKQKKTKTQRWSLWREVYRAIR